LPGLRTLITSYGIPDTVLRIKEYGGKDKVNVNDWDYWQDVFNYAFTTPSNNFISTNWKNNAINKTNQQIIKLENDYNELGKDDITLKELFDFIKSNSNFNRLFDEPFLIVKDAKDNYVYNYCDYSKYNDDMKHLTEKYEKYKEDSLNKIVLNINNCFNNNNEYKLVRFEKLRQYIIKEYTQIIKNHYKHIDIWFKLNLDNFKYVYTNEKLVIFQVYIRDNLYRYIYRYIYHDLNNNLIDLNNNDLLTENDEWKIKRDLINKSIKNYKKLKIFFENL
jgi:hypothetical protein